MASTVLLPPKLDSVQTAFVVNNKEAASCKIYFKYAKENTTPNSIHISILKQDSGQNVVNQSDIIGRYRSTGIIILNKNFIFGPNADGFYYVELIGNDIINGWTSGWTYKIQLRLSAIEYPTVIDIPQQQWLKENASKFSEWSTFTSIKAIGAPHIIVSSFGFDSDSGASEGITYELTSDSFEFIGDYSNSDTKEILNSYKIDLIKDDELIESSGILYTNEFKNPNQFHYLFLTELKNSVTAQDIYKVKLTYTTLHRYTKTETFKFTVNQAVGAKTNIKVVTIDNIDDVPNDVFVSNFYDNVKLGIENDEARVTLKLFNPDNSNYTGMLCVRRADSKDYFQTWTDIKIINCNNTNINTLDYFYDYTIESDIWYKYSVQTITADKVRGPMNKMDKPIIRELEYAFLLGEDGKQLKLELSNNISSYGYKYSEGSIETIGGQYPFISRNGATKYRSLPLSFYISFNMDEENTFTSMKELYQYDEIVQLYEDRARTNRYGLYNYKKERDFREKVLSFLQDGKPKLLKSATEGNLIVRLMNVATSPNQSTNRLIGTCSATAIEIADNTMQNYLKYKFYRVE